ncbi:hypothetical protein BC835DRAFT_1362226 [Cytidiella melzeri]|nr:hypothetical protein BC835DRAFT_1362226 [Cytidiella melzeri]
MTSQKYARVCMESIYRVKSIDACPHNGADSSTGHPHIGIFSKHCTLFFQYHTII